MKLKFLSICAVAAILFSSCSSDDSTSNQFMEQNPNAIARLITSIEIVSSQDATENRTITVSYDDANRVTNVNDGTQTALLAYENDNLANVASEGDTFAIEELYEAPYDAFETGEVINYNADGNPVDIRAFETEYDWNTMTDVTTEYRAVVEYDAQPNPYFYTIQAAGGIDIMDNVQLNFSANPDAPQIVQARMLFPSKNIKKISYRDLDGNLLADVVVDFVYNEESYPTSGTVTATSYDDVDGNDVSIYALTYTYMTE